MKRILSVITLILYYSYACAQGDTLHISSEYTSHLIFATDITYADLSNNTIVAAKVIEQNKNIIALKARTAFDGSTSISVLESNGNIHTFIISYEPSPQNLIYDYRDGSVNVSPMYGSKNNNRSVSHSGKSDAPLLQEVIKYKQRLFHIGSRQYGISAICENIISYSDITYMTFSLKNSSGVSYAMTDPTFVLESKKKGKRSVVIEKTIFPRNRFGNLSAGVGEESKATYSFDKMTLSDDQVLKVYFYEENGQRNLVMSIDTKDVNKASLYRSQSYNFQK